MAVFLLNRLWQSLILLIIVSMIGFAILNMIPGGPLSQFALDPGMTAADLDRLREQTGRFRCSIWTGPGGWSRGTGARPIATVSR